MGEDEKLILSVEAEDVASEKIDKVTRSVKNLEKVSVDTGNSMGSSISSALSSFESGVNRINNATRHYNMAMSGYNRVVRGIVKDMGASVVDFTKESINSFTEFSKQHALTLGAMSADYDKTAESQRKFFEDSQKLQNQAKQIGMYGVSGNGSLLDATGIAGAQTALVKAGVKPSDIVNTNVTSDVLKFAEGNQLNTETAVDFAVSLGSQFNVDISQWGDMLDKVSHTADMSIIDVKDIVNSMKYAGGITSGIGRDLEETLGTISILGNFGIKGSQAGSGIQALITRLLTGDTTVITQAQAEIAPPKALEKFYEFEKTAKPNGKLLPMGEVVDQLDAAMSDMTDEEQAWFAKRLFGLYQMKAAYALMNGEKGSLDTVIEEIRTQSAGTNQDKLNSLLDSQFGKQESLKNMWSGMQVDIGSRLNPFVNAVRDELFNFLGKNGNYRINFNNLRNALDESAGLIEEKYGSAIADAVRNMGSTSIDMLQIGAKITPAFTDGMIKMINSAFEFNLFGNDGVIANWGDMIKDMKISVEGLPEDLQGLGKSVVDCIDFFGKLTALNVASEIAELISSVLQILTIAGGAVINVAGGVVVNGTGGSGGTGTGGAGGVAGGAAAGSVVSNSGKALTGASVVGDAGDVAKALGTNTDDVIGALGKQAQYSIDDIARGLGASSDDVISAFGLQASGGLWNKLSKSGKALGAAGTAIQIGASGYEAATKFGAGDNKGGTQAIAGGAGSLSGSYVGAGIGTAIAPGIGTGVGALVGGLGGDRIARELSGDVYSGIDMANKNYGTPLAAFPLIGGVYRNDVNQQNALSKDMDSVVGGFKQSMSTAMNDIGGYTAKAWQMAFYYNTDKALYNKLSDEDKVKFNNIYHQFTGQTYPSVNNGNISGEEMQANAIARTNMNNATRYSLDQSGAKMLTVRKDDVGYDTKLDQLNQGYYKVWTGTRDQLVSYINSMNPRITTPEYKNKKVTTGATDDNPYMLNNLDESIVNAISGGLKNGMYSDTININSGSINMSDVMRTPNIEEVLKKTMPNGYNVLSNNARNDAVKNAMQNNITVDNNLQFRPVFNAPAPKVDVNVNVDRNGTVSKKTSIINQGQGTLMDEWYSRTLSRFGSKTR